MNKKVWETVHFQSFFKELALRMDGLFVLKKEVMMEMTEKKQNKPSIVQNKGVGSIKNTFEGKIQYLPLNQLVEFKQTGTEAH